MPASIKKSISRSLSKKWNSVRGNNNNNNNNKSSIIIDTTTTTTIDDNDKMSIDEAPVPPLRSSPSSPIPNNNEVDEEDGSAYYNGYNYCVRPSPIAEKTVPEAVVVSDTSSDDSDSGGEDNAAEKYGYGDASPDTEKKAFPKRLSTRNSIRRRNSSMCRQIPLALSDDDDDDENLPFDPQRAPRRSSIKGSCPQRARAARRRRASIATCTSISIEEELATGVLQPSQVLEIRVPGRRESIKRRTSITFNEDVNVRRVQAISQVEGAVKNELWFQDVEYTQIKKKTRALLEKVDSNGAYDGKKYCTRGLEKYMEDPRMRASKKYVGWDAVLMEQEMQRQLQIYDDESIGKFYKQTSTVDVVEATNRAQLDAEEVASFYTNTSTTQTQTTQSTTTAATTDDHDHVPDMTGLKTITNRVRHGRRASVA